MKRKNRDPGQDQGKDHMKNMKNVKNMKNERESSINTSIERSIDIGKGKSIEIKDWKLFVILNENLNLNRSYA